MEMKTGIIEIIAEYASNNYESQIFFSLILEFTAFTITLFETPQTIFSGIPYPAQPE